MVQSTVGSIKLLKLYVKAYRVSYTVQKQLIFQKYRQYVHQMSPYTS